jgi:NADH-quinone oxidoreductase subunit G
VVLSPFRSEAALQYADVLLPIAPFTETAGTFVNAEGRRRASTAWCALGESRPGWKVLRVLGNLLGLPGFDFDTAEAVRDAALARPVAEQLNNRPMPRSA